MENGKTPEFHDLFHVPFTISPIQAGIFQRPVKFEDQIRESTAAAQSNLSEGFERFYRGEFAYLARVAKGSLGESINHLNDPRAASYFPAEERESLLMLADRARRTTDGF